MDLYQLMRIYLLWSNNLIFCIRSWENQRLLPLPLLVLLHNQVHSIKLLQPVLYIILTLGSLIQELVIIWPKNPIFSCCIYPVLANKRCRLLLTSVSGKGNVSLSPKITLTSILYVPKMSCNLLSISKLTKTCFSNLFPKLLCFPGPHFREDDWQY